MRDCCCFISLVIAFFLHHELLHSYFWLCFIWKVGTEISFGSHRPALAIYCSGGCLLLTNSLYCCTAMYIACFPLQHRVFIRQLLSANLPKTKHLTCRLLGKAGSPHYQALKNKGSLSTLMHTIIINNILLVVSENLH